MTTCLSIFILIYCVNVFTMQICMRPLLSCLNKVDQDTVQATGGIQCLSWTPDGCAIAVAWSWACHGGLAVWSVFGSLLMCTLGGDYGYLDMILTLLYCRTIFN